MTLPALGLEMQCNDEYHVLPEDHPERHFEDPQLVLTVEYTPSATTAAFCVEQCGDYDLLYKVSSSNFEYNRYWGLACKATWDDSMNCDAAALQTAFHRLIKRSGLTKKHKLGVALIYGSRADEEDLLLVLRQVLTEEFSNGAAVLFLDCERLLAGSRFCRLPSDGDGRLGRQRSQAR